MSEKDAPQAVPFEQALESLQHAVADLESGELSLEDSLKRFEEGVRLTRTCQKYLSEAERRVELLTRADESGVETESFDQSE